jgi:hypothetical protein
VALLTSGGLYLKDRQSSFDLDRERQEPFWGDPTYRLIPRDVRHGEIAVAHLHLNPDDILADFNVALPLEVFGRSTLVQSCSEQSRRKGGGPVSNTKTGSRESLSISAE